MNKTRNIKVGQDVRESRIEAARQFRNRLQSNGTLIIRLISSPGAGKTSLLEKTAEDLSGEFSIAVLVGDVETDRDAQRLAPFAPSKQITTGGACHLELPLIERAWDDWENKDVDILFIEDIGNLICPASHTLGEHSRVILLSTTEGDDKPGKYPKAFRTSDALVITKSDLLPYVPFSEDFARTDALTIQPTLDIMTLSNVSRDGLSQWYEFLRREYLHHIATDAQPLEAQ